ncbi:nucleoside deaminase [Thiococcus pfennigii]|jgi:tRNA(Arg) A34 adenosine deaminase TadA|uniref:nucleoside deaminase n=1 Tax=Thiococcus pfennigii TaxID=1057 RepID=UPI0019063F46|nr:nucleoside deaminase [Thiococcus pfennigii]MBK1731869.1 tRNA-specific adenosine deaminase [Thiococcus pfennigii]
MIEPREIRIPLPDWLPDFLARQPARYPTDEAAMAVAIALAEENVRQRTGGPFGALVVASRTGERIAAGVNLVLASHCSIAHAEMVALASAQLALGDPDLGAAVPGGCTLVSSAEPCAMCMGAIPWSGVTRLVCGARDADVRRAGFDEGDKRDDWPAAFARRGIAVVRDCQRGRAEAVLQAYVRAGGPIY